jgi:SulP family sulfate permease
MSELRHAARMARSAPKPDVAILLLTFFLTVFVDLVVAVNVGVILAALLFMRRMADAVNIEEEAGATNGPGNSGSAARSMPDGVVVFSIEGPFFFGAAEKLERALVHIQRHTTLILRMGQVPFVDATGIFTLEEIITDFTRHGAAVLLAEVRPNVRYKLDRGGVIAHVGQENVTDTLDQALARAAELRAVARP